MTTGSFSFSASPSHPATISKETVSRTRWPLILGLIYAAAVCTQTMAATAQPASASVEWPVQDGAFDITNFRFHDGQTLPTLHLHYLTLGTLHRDSQGHADNAILLLHGTGGNARSLLAAPFSRELFGPGQPLDITRYFLIF